MDDCQERQPDQLNKSGQDMLTRSERRVLDFCRRLCTGNADILAAALCCSRSTVEHHLEHIRRKLDVHDAAGVMVAAYERGLVRVGEYELDESVPEDSVQGP